MFKNGSLRSQWTYWYQQEVRDGIYNNETWVLQNTKRRDDEYKRAETRNVENETRRIRNTEENLRGAIKKRMM